MGAEMPWALMQKAYRLEGIGNAMESLMERETPADASGDAHAPPLRS